MPRILGVDTPMNKKIWVGLTYIYGIGEYTSFKILKHAGIDPNIKSKDLTEEQVSQINTALDELKIKAEGALRRDISDNIARLKNINSYRGIRHKKGLPVRGQRTSCNARTRKGPKKTVAARKIATKK